MVDKPTDLDTVISELAIALLRYTQEVFNPQQEVHFTEIINFLTDCLSGTIMHVGEGLLRLMQDHGAVNKDNPVEGIAFMSEFIDEISEQTYVALSQTEPYVKSNIPTINIVEISRGVKDKPK